jgi:hypothetical protein
MIPPIIILFIESNLVGLFSVTLSYMIYFFLFSFSLKTDLGFNLYFFILGFLKHYFGYLLGLQTWYCKKRNKSNAKTNVKANVKAKSPSLLQNIQEGIAFLVTSFLIRKLFKTKKIYFISFLTGFILHIIAELTGIHTIFCKNLFT